MFFSSFFHFLMREVAEERWREREKVGDEAQREGGKERKRKEEEKSEEQKKKKYIFPASFHVTFLT